MTRCLVVDDDAEIRESLQRYLSGFGLQVVTAPDGRAMRREMDGPRFDVIVMDLMLPGEDGLSLTRWVQHQHGVPVIMLTARGDPVSRVVGLEIGADDYLPKPFEPRELVARIQAIVRRAAKARERGAEPGRIAVFDGWRFDRVLRTLTSPDDVQMALSNAEYRLLAAFIERAGRVLTRDALLELTRAPGVEVNDRSIDLAVSRLRSKLGDSPKEPRLIRTVRGEGYLFDAKVTS